MLTHPAWLVAHSGNFDTDPIRRGKWIREHLLADTIADILIGVDAALEEDPHQKMREKLETTAAAKCWRCHKKMKRYRFQSFSATAALPALSSPRHKPEFILPRLLTVSRLCR